MKRVSIAGLMAAVLACGVAGAALRNASEAWAGVLLLLTLLLLASSLLGVLHRTGGKRAFWQGFALFGWGYLLLAQAPWLADQVGPRLPTTKLLKDLQGKLGPEAWSPDANRFAPVAMMWTHSDLSSVYAAERRLAGDSSGFVVTRPYQGTTALMPGGSVVQPPASQGIRWLTFSWSNRDQFQRIGHCLFALLAAVAGGWVGLWFHRTNREGPVPGGDVP